MSNATMMPAATPILRVKRKINPIFIQGGGGDGGGGRGGGGRRGSGLPRMPRGNDIGKFLEFVHDLLQFWTDRVAQDREAFSHLDDRDRDVIRAGWEDFHAQWEAQREARTQAVGILQSPAMRAGMRQHGLIEDAMTMKWHFMKKRFGDFAKSLDFSKPWRKLLESADIILDSVKDVITTSLAPILPGAGMIVGGLKEFKDIAMTVSDKNG